MSPPTLFRRLVDSNSLAALGCSTHSEAIFTSVGLTTTANCFKEIRSGKKDPNKQYAYRKGAEVACQYLDNHEKYDNIALFPVPGSPVYSANNAGELSIRIALFERPDVFDTVITYDDDMGPILRPVRNAGIDVSILPPNEPLFFLYRKRRLSKAEYCTTTGEIVHDQGWEQSANVDSFWRFPVDCTSFR